MSDNLELTVPVAKLSKRLAAIEQQIEFGYDHIWDCCCDHGLLGAELLHQSRAPLIHFVDIVDSIIDELSDKLNDIAPDNNSEYRCHCLDVAALPLDDFPASDKHLIIVAGVGGELTLSMVEQILARHGDKSLEFILCPIRHQFSLRQQLRLSELKLVDERLIFDAKQYYEIIHLSNQRGDEIVEVGSKLWRGANSLHLNYIKQVLGHYQRMANNPRNKNDNAIYRYQKLLQHLERLM